VTGGHKHGSRMRFAGNSHSRLPTTPRNSAATPDAQYFVVTRRRISFMGMFSNWNDKLDATIGSEKYIGCPGPAERINDFGGVRVDRS